MRPEPTQFTGQGGARINALLALPDRAPDAEASPGIVLVHEVFGLDAHIRHVAQRLASEGFAVVAPDLYSREGVPGPASTEHDPAPQWTIEQIRAAIASLPDRRSLADLDAGAEFLGSRPGVDARRIGVLGFCMGGTLAFLLGCTSRRIAAVVDFYGRIQYAELSAAKPGQPLELALNLTAPLCAFFGERDASIPPEHIERLRRTLEQFGREAQIHVFPGADHGYFNDTRGRYDERAARASWALALAFLRETLGVEA